MSGLVRQIRLASEPSTPYFLRVDWLEDLGAGFTLALSDGRAAFLGEVSEEDVIRGANALGVKRRLYVDDLRQALTSRGEGRRGYGGPETEYQFHLSADNRSLSYKKKTQKCVWMNVGAVELHPAPDPVELNREMVGHTLGHVADLEAENRLLEEENQTLRQEKQHLLAEMERHVKAVKSMEGDTFSRSVIVLDEKRAKIRDLEDTIRRAGGHHQTSWRTPSDELEDTIRRAGGHHQTSWRNGTGITVTPETVDSSKEEQDEEKKEAEVEQEEDEDEEDDLSQSFHTSQAATVLIRGVSSQTSSMEDAECDSQDVLPSRKRQLCYPHIPGSKVKKPSSDRE
ncbi:hypothetical protein DPEC_G00125040 [Dallia pectoralis]|uniref:Uncharacterized protein n=1 Tax=Dallia pectoralis TaxID=75939 RepID=A0ACC2GR35_DALPE|nr:hypothetical protein DPEC_G00125040 [Dallia pectoralis]